MSIISHFRPKINGRSGICRGRRNCLQRLVMYRLRRSDVIRFAQNDVAPVGRNDAMFATMCRQAHIIREANIIRRSRHHLPKANIIQKTHLCR